MSSSEQTTAAQWSIMDDFEQPHVYLCIPFTGSKAWQNQRRIMMMVGQAVDDMRDGASDLMSSAEGMTQGAVVAAVAPVVGHIVSNIMSTADLDFVLLMLSGVMRDTAKFDALQNSPGRLAFDQAYQRNVGELYDALYHVIRFNYEPSIKRIIRKSGKWWNVILDTVLKQSGESETSSQAQESSAGLSG